MSASRLINLYVKPCSSLIEIISSMATEGKRSHLNEFGIQPRQNVSLEHWQMTKSMLSMLSTMALCRMAIKVRRHLRFSWHKKKHAETKTYCALQVRCSFMNDSLFPLARRARLTRTSVPSVKDTCLCRRR